LPGPAASGEQDFIRQAFAYVQASRDEASPLFPLCEARHAPKDGEAVAPTQPAEIAKAQSLTEDLACRYASRWRPLGKRNGHQSVTKPSNLA
jgi:hypothetical protein